MNFRRGHKKRSGRERGLRRTKEFAKSLRHRRNRHRTKQAIWNGKVDEEIQESKRWIREV